MRPAIPPWQLSSGGKAAHGNRAHMKIFTRTAVLSFGFAVAIGAAAEAQPLSTDRDMVTGVSVTEADCRALSGRLWVRAENRGLRPLLCFVLCAGFLDACDHEPIPTLRRQASEKRQCTKSRRWGTDRAAGYGDLAAGQEAVTTDRCGWRRLSTSWRRPIDAVRRSGLSSVGNATASDCG
jgi:hypothetical protein